MILLDKQLPTEISEYATNDEAIEIIKTLEWELKRSSIPGIGLAAPQIGINKAVAIVRVGNPLDNSIISINLVNPKLITAHDLIKYNEGCLSFPNQSSRTVRFDEIVIETADDYDNSSLSINTIRYEASAEPISLFSPGRRMIHLGPYSMDKDNMEIERLASICVQHEFSHLLALNFFDFKPQEVGRNDECPCGSLKKSKKCHNYAFYNKNLNKLFNPKYRGV